MPKMARTTKISISVNARAERFATERREGVMRVKGKGLTLVVVENASALLLIDGLLQRMLQKRAGKEDAASSSAAIIRFTAQRRLFTRKDERNGKICLRNCELFSS